MDTRANTLSCMRIFSSIANGHDNERKRVNDAKMQLYSVSLFRSSREAQLTLRKICEPSAWEQAEGRAYSIIPIARVR